MSFIELIKQEFQVSNDDFLNLIFVSYDEFDFEQNTYIFKNVILNPDYFLLSPTCLAITKSTSEPCTKNAKMDYNGFCGLHKNYKIEEIHFKEGNFFYPKLNKYIPLKKKLTFSKEIGQIIDEIICPIIPKNLVLPPTQNEKELLTSMMMMVNGYSRPVY